MKSNKKVPQPQQFLNIRQPNRISKQERQVSQFQSQRDYQISVNYAKNTIQQNCNIKIIDFKENERKENIKYPCRTEIPKWFDDQCKAQQQSKLRKPLTIEVDQNQKPRSYSAISARKQWSPPLKQMDKTEVFTASTLYFAYFLLDEKFTTFQPTIVPLQKENIEKCYQHLLNSLNSSSQHF